MTETKHQTPPERREPGIERARSHLWAVTFAIIAALAGSVVYFTGRREVDQLPLLLSGRLRLALGVMLFGFLAYVVDRERNLRRLSDRLTQERIASERLAANVENLRELQAERDTNASMLDGAADAIAVVGPDLRLHRFNAAMEQMTGVLAETADGARATSVLRFTLADGEPLTGSAHPLTIAMTEGRPVHSPELRLSGGTGAQDRWISATFSPIRQGDSPLEPFDPFGHKDLEASSGAPGEQERLVLVVLRDITEEKEMQALQRDFVSIVSHELRAPLTAIKGFAKTLVQRGDTLPAPTRAQFLQTVNQQADRLAHLVDDLLQVSKIDERRLRIQPEAVTVKELVALLLEQFGPKWPRQFIVDVPDTTSVVYADPRKFEEILINLIDNAVKYSPDGTPVRIAAREQDGEIELSVEDSGAGITPEDAAKLFGKFQRLSTPATRDVGGTGLGLYIVKGLVEAMGGRVWVESAPGCGATFAFTLPVSKPGKSLPARTRTQSSGLDQAVGA